MPIDPNVELHIKEKQEKFREKSDGRYAIKLVEKIVFGLVGFILIGFITALVALVIK